MIERVRKAFLTPSKWSNRSLAHGYHQGQYRPHAPGAHIAPIRVPCLGNCGTFVSQRAKGHYCTKCHEARAVTKRHGLPLAEPVKVQPLVVEQRTILVDGVEYVVMADGVGAFLTERTDTPRNFGSSLLDTSRAIL